MQSEEQAGYPLSPQQRDIWLRAGGDAACIPWLGRTMVVEASADAIREVLSRLLARHEILRTSFRRVEGLKTPLQEVADVGRLFVLEAHLRDGDVESGRAAALLGELRAEASDPCELPVRFGLLACSSQRSLVMVVASALCADAASLENLAREIIAGRE